MSNKDTNFNLKLKLIFQCFSHTETSQWICNENQITVFFDNLICDKWTEVQ